MSYEQLANKIQIHFPLPTRFRQLRGTYRLTYALSLKIIFRQHSSRRSLRKTGLQVIKLCLSCVERQFEIRTSDAWLKITEKFPPQYHHHSGNLALVGARANEQRVCTCVCINTYPSLSASLQMDVAKVYEDVYLLLHV